MTPLIALLGLVASLAGAVVVVQIAAEGQAAAQYGGAWTPTYNQDFPDPSIMSYDNTLYAYSTETVEANIPGAESDDAVNWVTVNSDIFPTLPSFAGGGMTWAPSVEQAADGQFVMYYTALNPAANDQCIGEATSSSPTGPFVDNNANFVICQGDFGGSIDPQIFTYPGGISLLWKSDGNHIGQATHIWSEPLDPNLELTGVAPTPLLTDDEVWQGGIVEGPNMVDDNGTFYLFYGGNHFGTGHYAVGYALCSGPAGPCTDQPGPILTTASGMSGPGGPAFFSLNGQLLMAFSAWAGVIGYPSGYRAMYVASMSFNAAGVPNFSPFNLNPGQGGYLLASSGGNVVNFGNAPSDGSLQGSTLNAPVVGVAATADAQGYWLVTRDGGVFSFGDAAFHGSSGGQKLNKPIVGMAADPATGGYWLVASDGGVFAYDAPYYGSMGGQKLNQPVVGMASTADGQGYQLVTRDGGVFSFGDAAFDGSMGGIKLNRPVVGIAADPATGGYWLVASDGGIFAFDAPYLGSMGGVALNRPIVGMASDAGAGGYWLVASDGGIFSFGGAPYLGSVAGQTLSQPTVGMAVAD